MGLAALVASAAIAGCKSKYVAADVKNNGSAPITLVELDYPSASFGVETLAPGAIYHYRFKILGGGGTKVLWTDAARKEHAVAGPSLSEGQEGSLVVSIEGESAHWSKDVRP